MSRFKRSPYSLLQENDIGTGPYLAKIVSHLDDTFMGGLEVTLLRNQGNDLGADQQTFQVRCAMPFFGYTAMEFNGKNKAEKSTTIDGYNDTQKSYGMWFVPPDIGVTVLVMFVDGDPSQGYWIGCVPSRFANNMVPGIAASIQVDLDSADKAKFNTKQPLPVAEVNRRLNSDEQIINDKNIKKVLHPIAERFLEQGLVDDDARGTTTSSARRDSPSMVFGISSPGPRDRRPGAKKAIVGKKDKPSKEPVPVSRLGGTQFVMDDGDEQFFRKTPASVGPVEYVDILQKEKGDLTIPYNEHFRIRTRTGHQLLFHNSEDLIYIANARGTAWIELSSNGKIDVFAEDSVSIHSKNDFNIRADRDINLEAGRNVNIKATAEYKTPTSLYQDPDPRKDQAFDSQGFENGRVYIESQHNMDLLIGRNAKIHVRNDRNQAGIGNLDIKVMRNMRISVRDEDESPAHTNVGDPLKRILNKQTEDVQGLHIVSHQNIRITTDKDLDILTKENVKINTRGNLDLRTTGYNYFTSGGRTDIFGQSDIHMTGGPNIHLNGPQAVTAAVAREAEISDKIRRLPVLDNPITDKDLKWSSTRYQVTDKKLKSLLSRIPMHEPWLLHENQAPAQLVPKFTDRELD
jgi:hypothetical protein